MARAYGSSAHLLMKRETTYGQAGTGDYLRIPFNRCDLGSEQDLIDDPVLGQGRDPLAPLQDVINDEGDIVVPVDPRYLGLWLTGLFGDPATTDNLDGSWDHVFASGGESLPSYTIEVGMPQAPAFFVHAGVKLDSIALEFTRSGPAAATIAAIAQGGTRFGTTQGGTPTSLTFNRISQFQGAIKRSGSPVGNLTAGSATYSNNLEKIETIRDDGLIEGADPTIAALTGRIDVRFADTTLIDLAAGGTPVDLEFAYTLSALGPGGVQASFDFRGARNDAAGRMLTVTLTNDLDGLVHGWPILSGAACGRPTLALSDQRGLRGRCWLQSLLRSWRRRLLSAKDVELVSRRGVVPGVHPFDERLLALPTGTVKWFNATKGFGFIQPEGGGPDAFVHISAVETAGLSTLNEGQRVQYELVQGQRGKSSAENLKLTS